MKLDIQKFGKKNIPIVKFKNFEGLDWLNCGFSTRLGGVSKGYFSSMNMSFCRGDDPKDVMENISIFADAAGFKPENIVMPHQCHTTNVQTVGKNECGRGVQLSLMNNSLSDIPGTEEEIDGQITGEKVLSFL
jgi:copper oxidase (laccase) domain-containing protein